MLRLENQIKWIGLLLLRWTGRWSWCVCWLAGVTLAPPIYAYRCGELITTEILSPLSRELILPSYLRHVVEPVLDEGDRRGFAELSQLRGNHLLLKSEASRNVIRFVNDPGLVYPQEGLPEVDIVSGRRGLRSESEIAVLSDPMAWDVERERAILRSALRADPYLHPLQWPEALPFRDHPTLAYHQREALTALLQMEKTARGAARFRRGISLPVAGGKTLVAGVYTDQLGQLLARQKAPGWKKKPKVLFVTQNRLILRRSIAALTPLLKIDSRNIAEIFGQSPGRAWGSGIPDTTEMIAITRSSYWVQMQEIHRLLSADPDQPWVLIMDEAHHIGREQGEFEDILKDLDAVADHRHRLLLLSATLWHQDRRLISEFLGGNVYGSFLNAEEQARLKLGLDLVLLCRLQYYRGMQQGYLAPVRGLQLVREVKGKSTADLLYQERYDAKSKTRQVVVPHSLVQDMARRIQNNRRNNVTDRGVIFAPTQAHATIYARELSKLLEEEVRPLHTGEGVDPDTYGWFADKEKKHKYVVVVDMFNEGVDIPPINLVILARPYTQTRNGFAALIQQLGRGNRTDAFKPELRVIDYTLYTRWLKDGLSSISVESRWQSTEGGRRGYVVVDDVVYDVKKFVAEFYQLFPGDGTFYTEYPFYDHARFIQTGLSAIMDLSAKHQLGDFYSDWGPKRLALTLAAELPDSLEKESLIARLEDDAYWGWSKSDGTMATIQKLQKPCQAAYRAFFEIGVLWKASGHSPVIDLPSLTDGEGLLSLHAALFPWWRDIEDHRHAARFIEPNDGALVLLEREGIRRNIPGVISDKERLKRLFVVMAQELELDEEQEEDRQRIIRYFEEECEWTDTDGNVLEAHRRHLAPSAPTSLRERGAFYRRPFQRSYRALAALAWLASRSSKTTPISLERIHERTEAEKLFSFLRPFAPREELDEDDWEAFRSESSAIAYLRDEANRFGIVSFTGNRFGTREVILQFARLIPDETDRAQVLDWLSSPRFGWTPADGANALHGIYSAAARIYRALYGIAVAYNRTAPPGKRFPLQELTTADGMQKLHDLMTLGTSLGRLTPEQCQQFWDPEFGALEYLMNSHPRLVPIGPWSKEFGALLFIKELARALPPSEEKTALMRWVGDVTFWNWKKTTGALARERQVAASQVIYRAFRVIALLYRRAFPGKRIVLSRLHLRSEARKIIESLLPPFQDD